MSYQHDRIHGTLRRFYWNNDRFIFAGLVMAVLAAILLLLAVGSSYSGTSPVNRPGNPATRLSSFAVNRSSDPAPDDGDNNNAGDASTTGSLAGSADTGDSQPVSLVPKRPSSPSGNPVPPADPVDPVDPEDPADPTPEPDPDPDPPVDPPAPDPDPTPVPDPVPDPDPVPVPDPIPPVDDGGDPPVIPDDDTPVDAVIETVEQVVDQLPVTP